MKTLNKLNREDKKYKQRTANMVIAGKNFMISYTYTSIHDFADAAPHYF